MTDQLAKSPEILFIVENHVGIIVLNRPSALNALSFEMIHGMMAQLTAWQLDEQVHWVLVKSSSPKAFCAGGDVRALHELQGDLKSAAAYFTAEYTLNHLIHTYSKPYVALMDGITMGGGMGISQGAGLRIVSENSRLAMPETAIGLIPDVGGSYFLSRTSDNPAVGRYLAVTGSIVNATDALRWRLADTMVAQSIWAHLIDALIECDAPTLANLTAVAESFARNDLPAVFEPMSAYESEICDAFDESKTLSQIRERLTEMQADSHQNRAEWSTFTLSQLAYNSPVMMEMALTAQAIGKTAALADCLRLEFNSIYNALELGEANEGIRAKIIDKDHKPNWQNIELGMVLKPPFTDVAHPLALLRA